MEEEDWKDPEVNFSLMVASNVHPETILDRICLEWKKSGGNRLYVKELCTHDPKQAVVLYKFYNRIHLIMDIKYVLHVQALFGIAKTYNLVDPI